MPIFKVSMETVTGKTINRYIESNNIASAKALAEGCFIDLAKVKTIKVQHDIAINGYIITPSSSAMW